jgi:hypothetical protein
VRDDGRGPTRKRSPRTGTTATTSHARGRRAGRHHGDADPAAQRAISSSIGSTGARRGLSARHCNPLAVCLEAVAREAGRIRVAALPRFAHCESELSGLRRVKASHATTSCLCTASAPSRRMTLPVLVPRASRRRSERGGTTAPFGGGADPTASACRSGRSRFRSRAPRSSRGAPRPRSGVRCRCASPSRSRPARGRSFRRAGSA